MSKKNIVTIVGARPQFIKAAPVSRALAQEFNEILIHTGQHYDYGMSEVFFQEMEMRPADFNLGAGGGTHGEQNFDRAGECKFHPDRFRWDAKGSLFIRGALHYSERGDRMGGNGIDVKDRLIGEPDFRSMANVLRKAVARLFNNNARLQREAHYELEQLKYSYWNANPMGSGRKILYRMLRAKSKFLRTLSSWGG